MTFRASSLSCSQAYDGIKAQALGIRNYLDSMITQFQQPTTNADVPLAVIRTIGRTITQMDVYAAVPGLATYAQGQEGDAAYNVAAEYAAMRTALGNALATLISSFPKDASGNLLFEKLNADGSASVNTFTAAQLAGVVTLLQSVTATIS